MTATNNSTNSTFKIAIVGLGLIGGSLAYALKGFKDCEITGYDIDPSALGAALKSGAIQVAVSSPSEAVEGADLSIFSSNPASVMDNIQLCAQASSFKANSTVTEICGLKEEVSKFIDNALPKHIDYVGIHPMAGKAVGGFKNAEATLFNDAGFIVIPSEKTTDRALAMARELITHVGATRIEINDAEKHDRIIAYTSDLMHISAAALCENYPPDMTLAHTAGAFAHSTRVGQIDADLWTELLSDNAKHILPFLSEYIKTLNEIKTTLENNDDATLHTLLSRACKNKESMMGL